MKPYYELSILDCLYLEDSYVLGVEADKTSAIFTVEFVLTEKHSGYLLPKKGQQYCYKKGKLKFEDCEAVSWAKVNHVRNIDKNLEIDMGNIDVFTFDENKYFLSGDWGEIEIISENVSLDFCVEVNEKGSD